MIITNKTTSTKKKTNNNTFTPSKKVTNAYKQVTNIKKNKPSDYTPSKDVTNAYNDVTNIKKNKPENYVSKWQEQIDEQVNNILNREKFQYDFNADPLYQQYKNQYKLLGQQAMQDTMADAATLSGGYGNSYAATAGQQAYNSYLGKLQDIVPELYSQARNIYDSDTESMYNKFSMLQGLDDGDYSKYRDSVSDYYNELGHEMDWYNTLYNNDYNKHRDTVSDYYNNLDQATDWYKTLYGNDYDKYRDETTDSQWQQEFTYQKEQDKADDAKWQQEFAYQKAQDAQAYDQWLQEFNYEKSQDKKGAKASAGESASYGDVKNIIKGLMEDGDSASAADRLGSAYENGLISDEEFNALAVMYGIDFEDIDTGIEVKAPNLLTEAEYNKLKNLGDKRVIYTKSYDDYVKQTYMRGMAGI